MATPKFKVGDQVVKKKIAGIALAVGSITGEITTVIEKHNKGGRIAYYYGLKWPDGRRSEHAQHILVPAP